MGTLGAASQSAGEPKGKIKDRLDHAGAFGDNANLDDIVITDRGMPRTHEQARVYQGKKEKDHCNPSFLFHAKQVGVKVTMNLLLNALSMKLNYSLVMLKL